MTNLKQWNPKQVLAISNGHFWNDFYMAIYPSIIPILAINYHYSLTQLSLMMTIMTVVSSFIQPYLGFVIDKKGQSRQLIYSLLWITILMSTLGFFKSFYALVLIMTLASLGCSFYHPLGSLLVTNVAGGYRERAMSIFLPLVI